MIVAVQGTKDFSDYNVFLRAISVALSEIKNKDSEFIIYSAGPLKVNNFVSEFCNLSERGMKSRGKKIKFYNTSPIWLSENIQQIDYFIFLSREKNLKSKLVLQAEKNNINIGFFKY